VLSKALGNEAVIECLGLRGCGKSIWLRLKSVVYFCDVDLRRWPFSWISTVQAMYNNCKNKLYYDSWNLKDVNVSSGSVYSFWLRLWNVTEFGTQTLAGVPAKTSWSSSNHSIAANPGVANAKEWPRSLWRAYLPWQNTVSAKTVTYPKFSLSTVEIESQILIEFLYYPRLNFSEYWVQLYSWSETRTRSDHFLSCLMLMSADFNLQLCSVRVEMFWLQPNFNF
jgi:hypothetical protein